MGKHYDIAGNTRHDCDICGAELLPTKSRFNHYHVEICMDDIEQGWDCCGVKCARMALRMAEYEKIKAKKRKGWEA